jgi:hypothetical protein
MNTRFATLFNAAAYLPRMLVILGLLVVPVLAMPQADAGLSAPVIEHASPKSKGVGFVLLMSLQR